MFVKAELSSVGGDAGSKCTSFKLVQSAKQLMLIVSTVAGMFILLNFEQPQKQNEGRLVTLPKSQSSKDTQS
jgi:hypothetical protein